MADSKSQESENLQNEINQNGSEKINSNANKANNIKHTNFVLVVCVIGLSLTILTEIFQAQYRRRHDVVYGPYYWVHSTLKGQAENKSDVLKHVHLVLERVGFEMASNATPWTLLWSHTGPFKTFYPSLKKLKPHQKVNHFPGTGYITSKVVLATSNIKYIPKAFQLPKNKEDFLKYAAAHKDSLFVQKSNKHRRIYIKNVTDIDFSSGKSFVQEYIQNPFLVDGHKFDIGVYVALTSVNPLRVYWYKGDVLFRYCLEKYYPFDPNNLLKNVVRDKYRPTWEVPSLAYPHSVLGFGMKGAFETYLESKGENPSEIWKKVLSAITETFLAKEHHVIAALKKYQPGDNFFELIRFDLILDADLKVYLMEANMSPNLFSNQFPPNRLLYEQVLYSLFKLTGVADLTRNYLNNNPSETQDVKNMISAQKNIAVFGQACITLCTDNCEAALVCKLCRPCLNPKLKNSLLTAHREHLHRGDFRRLFPPPMDPESFDQSQLKNLSQTNQLQYLWYQGKCKEDPTFCT